MSASRWGPRRWLTSWPGSRCSSSCSGRRRSSPASPTTTDEVTRVTAMSDPVAELREAIAASAAGLRDGGGEGASAPTLERPPKREFGDYSTNAAMLLAPTLGEPPPAVAERLAEELREELGDSLDRVEVAGPGFLNLFLSDA